jgi:hypothetical protein
MNKFPLSHKIPHLLLFALLSCCTAFSAQVGAPVTDTFHEGEYLGFLWHMKAYYQGLARFPLLVHGGMDYMPSVIAAHLFGDNVVIVGTRIILLIISAVMYFLFLDICNLMSGRGKVNLFWMMVSVLIFYYFTPPLNSNVVDVTYFPVREIFLFLTIWGHIRHATTTNRLSAFLFLAVSSVSTIVALFWCYNRGMMAVAFFAVAMVGFVSKRDFARIIIAASSALLCLGLLEASKIFGSIKENIHNISYWVVNEAEINKSPVTLKTLPGYLGVLLLSIFAIATFLTVYRAKKTIGRDEEGLLSVIIGLMLVQLLLIKTSYHGVGAMYAFYSAWPSILVMLYIGSVLLTIRINAPILLIEKFDLSMPLETVQFISAYKLSAISLVVFLIFASPKLFIYTRFAKKLISPNKDVELISDDMLKLKDVFYKNKIDCYFNWTNDGVIALVTKCKYCTDYSYVHYASCKNEQNMLYQLKAASPEAIVYDSKSGSVELDQIRMSQRFPSVNKYIQENYQGRTKVGTYLLAIKGLSLLESEMCTSVQLRQGNSWFGPGISSNSGSATSYTAFSTLK